MSYSQKGTLFNYFAPDAAAVSGVIDIGAASADAGEWTCVRPCTIKRLTFAVTDEAVAGTTTAPTVVFTKRPTPNSAAGEEVVGTLTIPDGTAIGKVLYKDVAVEFEVGDSLEISHTVGVGSPAGQGIANAVCDDDPEVESNMLDMILSD